MHAQDHMNWKFRSKQMINLHVGLGEKNDSKRWRPSALKVSCNHQLIRNSKVHILLTLRVRFL